MSHTVKHSRFSQENLRRRQISLQFWFLFCGLRGRQLRGPCASGSRAAPPRGPWPNGSRLLPPSVILPGFHPVIAKATQFAYGVNDVGEQTLGGARASPRCHINLPEPRWTI